MLTKTTINAEKYDRSTMILHWTTAILVLALWTLGQTIDWFPKGFLRNSARSSHIVLGLTLSGVIVYRIWWRATSGRHLPADGGALGVLSTWAHRVLYLMLLSTVALGTANTWVRGDTIFNLIHLTSFAPNNKSLRNSIEDLHGLSANVLIALAGFHALAGLFHYFVFKDRVLQRMTP